MNLKKKSKYIWIYDILIWIFAIVFTVGTAFYQKMTGPTYPVIGHTEIGGGKIKFRLIRSYDLADDAKITVVQADRTITGEITMRRYTSSKDADVKKMDQWQTQMMVRHGDTLIGALPHQAPAGKVEYQVTLVKGGQRVLLNEHPAILRYTGYVPRPILFPHILTMFMAMLFSALTGLMVIFNRKGSYVFAWITVVSIGIGGLLLGPIVQKFAFGAYWTGWPFGHDLTDNKSLIAFIFWAIALLVMRKNRQNKLWPIVASIALLVVFLIPHSTLGSDIDYTKEKKTETTK